jgi:hypothetical protein
MNGWRGDGGCLGLVEDGLDLVPEGHLCHVFGRGN